jgi:hypothetical protein
MYVKARPSSELAARFATARTRWLTEPFGGRLATVASRPTDDLAPNRADRRAAKRRGRRS